MTRTFEVSVKIPNRPYSTETITASPLWFSWDVRQRSEYLDNLFGRNCWSCLSLMVGLSNRDLKKALLGR